MLSVIIIDREYMRKMLMPCMPVSSPMTEFHVALMARISSRLRKWPVLKKLLTVLKRRLRLLYIERTGIFTFCNKCLGMYRIKLM